MAETPKHETSARPYFIPREVDYDSLPAAVQAAFQAIVGPCYEELVLGATGALERSAGVTLTFLMCAEILDHFAIGAAMNFSGAGEEASATARDQQIARHLRLVGAKQRAENFLMRIRVFRANSEPDPLEPPVV